MSLNLQLRHLAFLERAFRVTLEFDQRGPCTEKVFLTELAIAPMVNDHEPLVTRLPPVVTSCASGGYHTGSFVDGSRDTELPRFFLVLSKGWDIRLPLMYRVVRHATDRVENEILSSLG